MLDGLILSDSQRDSLTKAAHRYHESLPEVLSYLEARGIDRTAASGFLLGTVSSPAPGHERFRGMLSIPYLTPAGVVGFKFRRIDDSEEPKYDSPSGQKPRLYNAQSLSDGGEVVLVVEGELGAIVAQRALSVPSVGVPGVSTWIGNPHWARCFADFDRIVVIPDNDSKEDGSNPGLKLGQRIVKDLEGAELIAPPLGMDADEWILEAGADRVREAIGVCAG